MLQSCAHPTATWYSCFSHSNFKCFLMSYSCITLLFYLYFSLKIPRTPHTKYVQLPFLTNLWWVFFPHSSGCCSNRVLTLHNSHSFHVNPRPVFCHPSWITFCAMLMLWTCRLDPSLPSQSGPAPLACVRSLRSFIQLIQFLLFSPSCLVFSVALSSNMAHTSPFLWKAA